MVCVASYGHLKKVSQNFVKFLGLFVKNCKKWVVFQKKENEKAAKAEKKCESDYYVSAVPKRADLRELCAGQVSKHPCTTADPETV